MSQKNCSTIQVDCINRKYQLKYIYENPGSKVTHRLFLSGEYIFYDENTDSIRDEENNLFEDWRETDYSYNGILTRCTPVWQDGWSLYDINITQ